MSPAEEPVIREAIVEECRCYLEEHASPIIELALYHYQGKTVNVGARGETAKALRGLMGAEAQPAEILKTIGDAATRLGYRIVSKRADAANTIMTFTKAAAATAAPA